ncbi:MAG UNVERIFIED_CONTAM: hypothetical protein LVR18_41135 [Planctomycetaceae bacterium]|jgi:hypothetical protein
MRHWTVFAVCSLLTISVASSPAAAQLRATRISPAQLRQAIEAGIDPSELMMMQDGSDPSAMSPADGEGSVPDSPDQLAQQKQQLLQSLEFDRRPSSILKLWASSKPAETPATPAVQPQPNPPAPTPEPTPTPNPDPAAAERAAAAAKARADFLQFRAALSQLKRTVTQGDWSAVQTALKTLPEPDRRAGL